MAMPRNLARIGVRRTTSAAAVLAAAVLLATAFTGQGSAAQAGSVADTSAPPSRDGTDIALGAVGDINPDGQTSSTSHAGLLASSMKSADLDAVAVLGDFQYDYGDCASYVKEFDKTGMGSLLPKMIGAAGTTHDWTSYSDQANYRSHMAGTCPGQTTGPSLQDVATGVSQGPESHFVVDLGAWRVYSLSSGLWRYKTSEASAATTWLDRALAAGAAAGDHAVVIWHEPYWASVSEGHGPTTTTKPWVNLLDKYDVSLVLSGHQHGYERFHPMRADSSRDDETGTQQFIVGTGGIGFYPWTSTAANSAVQQSDTYGWLRLTLHPNGQYDYRFVRTAGGEFTDSGSR